MADKFMLQYRQMESLNRNPLSERNPRTHAAHKREVFWQITLPLILGLLLVVAALVAVILSALQPVTDLERWADVSLMWMILPSLFFALILLVITVGLVVLVSILLRKIPHYALLIQLFFEQITGKVAQLMNRVVEPILRINSLWASVRRAVRLGR